jgi:hypothetical protein
MVETQPISGSYPCRTSNVLCHALSLLREVLLSLRGKAVAYKRPHSHCFGYLEETWSERLSNDVSALRLASFIWPDVHAPAQVQ